MFSVHKKLVLSVLLVCLVCVSVVYAIFGRETLIEKCKRIDSPTQRVQCLIPYFIKLTGDTSAKEAIFVAKTMQKEGVIDDCHVIAHDVGAENLRKNNGDAGKAFATCTMDCIEGCYHGVMEEYVKQKQETEISTDELLTICNSLEPDATLKRQCLHGVGHGLLRHGTASLEHAILTCKNFPDYFSASTCLGGVFMQNMRNLLTENEQTFIERIKTVCSPDDIPLAGALRAVCVEAIGPGIMFYTGHDLEKTKDWCLYLDTEDQQSCIFNAEEELKLHNTEVEG